MIALARVDDRLMHGQVSVGWVPHLHATVVVVANDRVAADPLLSGICQACSSGFRVEVVPVAEAARRGAGSDWAHDTVIMLFENLQDARRAMSRVTSFLTVSTQSVGKPSWRGRSRYLPSPAKATS